VKYLNLTPVWLAAFIVAAWGIARLSTSLDDILVWPGWVLIATGIALTIWSAVAFRRVKTTIVPHQSPSALVDTGPFRFSRNPIYLADLVILAGVALILSAPLALLLLVPFQQVLLRLFILPEEATLARDLGQPYLQFKAKVRRWL
jgi:protein-S-isoprenylcysteine O-methyltransferase Ste14